MRAVHAQVAANALISAFSAAVAPTAFLSTLPCWCVISPALPVMRAIWNCRKNLGTVRSLSVTKQIRVDVRRIENERTNP